MRGSYARRTSAPLTLSSLNAAMQANLAMRRQQQATQAQRQHDDGDLDASRERCRTLVGFIREAWHVLEPMQPYVHGFHLDAIAVHLEAITAGQLQHVLFNVPPGSMKSLMVSVFFTAWEWGPANKAWLRNLASSYEQDLALRDARKLRKLLESDWYQARWPGVKLTSRGVELFENTEGGSNWSRAFMSMTGGRANRVKLDDPHSTTTAESDIQRAKTVLQFREGITDRLNNMDTDSIIVMMQRLHANDVSGSIERLGLDFTRVVIPMEYEPQRACTTKWWTDPRSYDGELMCPERWSRKVVADLKVSKGSYAYAGQYLQRPTPREGGLFKREWFKERTLKVAPPFVAEVRHWDLADTDLKATDTTGARSAGVRMGLTADGRFVVTNCHAVGRENVAPLIKSTAVADGKTITVSLPQDPGQAGKVQKRAHAKLLTGWKVKITRETGDKLSRAEPLATVAEAGNLWLVEGPWNDEYVNEMCDFPGGARKDIADASSGCFAYLVPFLPDDDMVGLAGPEVIDQATGQESQPYGGVDADADVWS